MLIRSNHLYSPVIYIGLAILARLLWDISPLLIPLTWAMYAAASLALADWIGDRITDLAIRAARARSLTPENELAGSLARMNAEQLEMFKLIYERRGENLTTETIGIPDEWILDYLHQADGYYLAPVRTFPEGSRERTYAKTITDYLINQGAAASPTGPHPARVVSWKQVTDALGWS